MRSRSIVRCASGVTSVAIFGVLLAGCLSVDPPEGTIQCTTNAECPSSEWTCRASRCYRGGSEEDAGVDASEPIDADVDGAIDAQMSDDTGTDAPSDAGPITDCNANTNVPCAADQRCAWVRLTPATGETRCLSNESGTGRGGDACEIGPKGDLGYDDCARGFACINGTCAPICNPENADSCAPTGYCTLYSNLFSSGDTHTAGVCQPSCNPLTQELPDGSSCPSGQACYELIGAMGSSFLCAPEGMTAIGATLTEPVYANSCEGGARALRRPDGTLWCAPFCRPLETHSAATAGAHGAAPYSCGEVGAGATDACLFDWIFSGDSGVFDPRLNQLGLCVPVGTFEWDHDMNAGTSNVPWPSCTTLANTDIDGDGTPDHLTFGCGPAAAP